MCQELLPRNERPCIPRLISDAQPQESKSCLTASQTGAAQRHHDSRTGRKGKDHY